MKSKYDEETDELLNATGCMAAIAWVERECGAEMTESEYMVAKATLLLDPRSRLKIYFPSIAALIANGTFTNKKLQEFVDLIPDGVQN